MFRRLINDRLLQNNLIFHSRYLNNRPPSLLIIQNYIITTNKSVEIT